MNWKTLICSLLVAWPARADEFKEANALYDAGKFADAIAAYEKIKPKSAHVLYNLGNAYYRDGQLGQALLRYERAQWLAPRDPDILANLKFTEQRLGVDTVNAAPNTVRRFLESAAFSRTIDEWSAYELISLWAMALAIGAGTWGRKARTVSLSIAAVCFALLLASASALAYRVHDRRASPRAIVLANDTAARFAPLPDSTAHFKLAEGTKVAIRENRGQWLYIERADGQQGWVSANAVARIEP
jgi:tetratricopeptide (TPR) repeat protein